MKKIILGLYVIGSIGTCFSQINKTEELSEVVVTAVNYKYLNTADSKDAAIPVKLLQRKAASFNVKESNLYDEVFEKYTVSFFIPEGKIVAVYNQEGKIIRTIEKFVDIKLPEAVGNAVAKKFPAWEVIDDVYLLNYSDIKGANKVYKLKIKKEDKYKRVKLDETGNFLK